MREEPILEAEGAQDGLSGMVNERTAPILQIIHEFLAWSTGKESALI